MTREKAIEVLESWDGYFIGYGSDDVNEALNIAIEELKKEPRKGHWLRMSDLSEQKDDRYKCSRCGNVVHHTNKMNLYTFNSWCGRCGSDNGRKRG